MCVLLVNPPMLSRRSGACESFIAGQKRRLKPSQYYSLPIEHLGFMSIAAYAQVKGIDVQVINGLVAGHYSLEQTWDAIQAVAGQFGEPALIGFSNIDTFHEFTLLARYCRREWENVRIVLGNTFGTLNWRRVLRECADLDFVIVGDGEASFTQLAELVLNGNPVDSVPGLVRRQSDGSVYCTPPAAVNLDELPWASRNELATVLHEGFAAAVYTSRGCPYRCTFCGTGAASDILGRDGYRMREMKDVVDEIDYLVADFGIDFVSISDDLFLTKSIASQDRAAAFAREMIRRNVKIRFMLDARVDSIVDLSLFALLKQAGLQRVFIGLETGSYEQLVNYRKGHFAPSEDPTIKVNALRELGIEVIPGTIMFHPTVKPREIRETLRLLTETGYRAPYKLIERIVAYSGTHLHAEYAAQGLIKQDWPIGEWDFADRHARVVYEATAAFLKRQENVDFDAAANFLLERISEWETRMSPDSCLK